MRSDTWPFGDVFEWVPVLGAIPAEQLEGARPLHRVTRDPANTLTALPDAGQPSKDVCALEQASFECKLAAQKGTVEP